MSHPAHSAHTHLKTWVSNEFGANNWAGSELITSLGTVKPIHEMSSLIDHDMRIIFFHTDWNRHSSIHTCIQGGESDSGPPPQQLAISDN